MMNSAYWCVLIAGVLPYLTVAIAKFRRGYDNANPRAWLDKQEGLRRRADYAHRNHFEAFPFFAAAVIIAQQLHGPQASIDKLAVSFILARIVYTLFYLANRSTLRTVAFCAGYACVLGLFLLAASGA
jgi:uncharacterized MAPEG superfamily protein